MQSSIRRLLSALVVVAIVIATPLSALAASVAKPAESIAAWNSNEPEKLTASNLYAQSAVLIDARSGEVLFEKSPDVKLNPASITKILTALIVLEKCDLNETMTAKLSTMGEYEPTWLPLKDGETFKIKDMLYGLLMKSYNDVAAALAVHVGGSLSGFAEMMNRKAQELGCTNSNFVVPHGLTTKDHYTTASDMAKIAMAAMQNETFRKIVSTRSYTIPASNKRDTETTIQNGNKMLPDSGTDYAYEGCIGVKTGYTLAAQHTFVAAAQRDGVNLICVILGTSGTKQTPGDGKWLDAQKMLDYGFAMYKRVDIPVLYASNPVQCNIEGTVEGDTGVLKLELGDPSQLSGIIARKDSGELTSEAFERSISVTYTSDLRAPVKKGQKIAELTYAYGNGQTATVDLLASRDILQAMLIEPSTPDTSSYMNNLAAPPTLTDIAINTEQSPARYLAWLLLVPVALLIGLIVSMMMDVSRRRRRLRGRISRSRGY